MIWECPDCGGKSIGVSLLNRIAPQDKIDALWARGRNHGTPTEQPCPHCAHPMRSIESPAGDRQLALCLPCYSIWLDADEFRKLHRVDPDSRDSWDHARIESYRSLLTATVPWQERVSMDLGSILGFFWQ